MTSCTFFFFLAKKIPLVQALANYRELKADDLLTMMVPHQPLYPLSKIHVPVFLQQQPGQNVAVFIVRYVDKKSITLFIL